MTEPTTPTPSSAPVDQLFRLRDAAKQCGLGYHTLLNAVKCGDLVGVQIGSHYRVTARALNNYVAGLESGRYAVKTRPAA